MFGLLAPWRERRVEGEPANPLRLLRDEVDTLFDRFMEGWMVPADFRKPAWGWDVEEKENELVLRAEMPGFDPKEVEVTLSGNLLTIRAEHKVEGKDKEPREMRRVERTVTLPEGAMPEKVEATFRNGVLEVHFPRTPAAAPRRIDVKT